MEKLFDTYDGASQKGRKYIRNSAGDARLGVRVGTNKMLGDHYLRIKYKGTDLNEILENLNKGEISQEIAVSKIERIKEQLVQQMKGLANISDKDTCSISKGHTRIVGADVKRYAKELLSAINKTIEENREKTLVR